MTPKYPEITVTLTGTDGNAFAVLGHVSQAMRRAGIPKDKREEFLQEAAAGNYGALLQTVMRWVEVA
jgi:hypothetical protein